MRQVGLALALASAVVMVSAANAKDVADAAFCFGCSSSRQFELAAVEGFGAGLVDPRPVVVGDPIGRYFWRVTLARPAAGGSVKIVATSQLSSDEAEALLGHGTQAKVFVTTCNGVVQLPSDTRQRSGPVERGTLVRLEADVYGLVLCSSPLFASYSTARRAALSRAMELASLRWAMNKKGVVKTYARMFVGGSGETRARSMPKPHEVCAIFNNGDSACFTMAGAPAPAGNPQAGAFGSSSGMTVSSRGSKVEYGAPGSTGLAGETSLVCNQAGGAVSDCLITTR